MISWDTYFDKKKNNILFPESFCVRMLFSNEEKGLQSSLKLGEDSNILDLGCGNGRNLSLLKLLSGKLHASDISEQIVQPLKKTDSFKSVDFSVQKLPHTSFKNDYFKCILSCNSCYYLESDNCLNDNLKEIQRILCNGGFFAGTLVKKSHTIFKSASFIRDNIALISEDRDNVRQFSRMAYVKNHIDLRRFLRQYFENIKIGFIRDEYNDFKRHLYYFTCTKIK